MFKSLPPPRKERGMKLTIRGKPKEIAALVSELQGRQGRGKPRSFSVRVNPPVTDGNDLVEEYREAAKRAARAVKSSEFGIY